jgi:disulfide bond formation protein DsbB
MPRKALAALLAAPHLAALAFSAAALAAALVAQHGFGLVPCHLCVLQRWAHAAVIGCALLAWAARRRFPRAAALPGGALLAAAAVAFWHVGVEGHWWEASCAVSMRAAADAAEMRAALLAAPVARCDVAPWSLMGLSMAGWDCALSAVAGIAVIAAAARPRGPK